MEKGLKRYGTRIAERIYGSLWYRRLFLGSRMQEEQLLLLHPGEKAEPLLRAYHVGKIKKLLLGLAAALLLVTAGGVRRFLQRKDLTVLWVERPGYAGEEHRETWEVRREDGQTEEVNLTITGRQYTSEATEALLEAALKELEHGMLGENENADRIEYPLSFPDSAMDGQVTVQWFSDHPEILNAQGQIAEDYMEEDGVPVEIRAVLSCQDREAFFAKTVRVYPKKREEEAMFYRRLQETLKQLERMTREEEGFALPDHQDGQAILFRKKAGKELLLLGLLCLAGGILLFAAQDERLTKEAEKRREQLLIDYPEIVSRLTVLLRSGLTAKTAFGKITADYQRRKARDKVFRYAYEELSIAWYEMANAVPEDKCYESFGRRCGLLPYMRLGGLLAQNVKKGNKSLLTLLGQEAGEALEERKRRAKKAGEKAGTRMLVPMVLMLLVTMVILLYPAFSSFQI